jgi:hypothetical protein
MLRRRRINAVTAVAVTLALYGAISRAAEQIPARLADQEFWALTASLSEPSGSFRSDNLLSNELRHQFVIPELKETAMPGRAYIGVGPEQNFTYIAALQPSIAFIVDIRRGNLQLHLMYKALFELSADRAEFVSRLFSRKQPDGLRATSTAAEIFAAYADVEANRCSTTGTLKRSRHSSRADTGSDSRARISPASNTCIARSSGSVLPSIIRPRREWPLPEATGPPTPI